LQGVHFSNILEDPKIHCYFVILFILNTVRYNAISNMAEASNIGEVKITAPVCKKVQNFWKEEK